jgi:type IV secretory pathway VirB2 component (pilin)
MSFRAFSATVLEPLSIWVMVAGIIFLCQPWIASLHSWSVLVMLIGLIGFNISGHVPLPTETESDEASRG